MSWLSKLLPPKVNVDGGDKANVPEGLWHKCDSCNEILYYTDLEKNYQVCPKCNYHHYMSARKRLDMLLDSDGRVEIGAEVRPVDILKFKDSKKYADRLEDSQNKVGESDAIVVMQGTMNKQMVVIAAFEFKFIGAENNCPFICVATSGGARMMEGANSLMQMTKTSAVLHLLSVKKLPFISVLTDPNYGGVSASFAFLGDVVVAEPGASIGFAGKRVIEQTVREKLPEGFQTAEFLLEKGAIDMVVTRQNLKYELARMIALLVNREIV